MKRVKKILRERAASPLVEEGILLSLAVASLAVVLSLIVSIFGGVNKLIGAAETGVSSFFEAAIKKLDDLLKQLSSFITG
ncbi:MAG: hypothetical protein N3H31_02730 [Candidatus Nezhaarchaeota archaeon]|nr:hypothetical protein [Candidatus Nezhaarchaeota archaeon]